VLDLTELHLRWAALSPTVSKLVINMDAFLEKMTGIVSLGMPSFDFWYSTTFWVYVFWVLW
jgi:hypothetical protein